ncbi:MAG: SpoIIE family protein phosphatase [Planctomycetes bacterium]|nr:SpoIIE family protein phosphatase [Planctomycetota bacterium]
MSKRGSKSTGRLALRLAIVCGLAAALGAMLIVALMGPDDRRQWLFGALLSLVVGAVVALVAWSLGTSIGGRLTDLGLAVSKLGRGGTEVRVRNSGNDEVTALGRAVQYLATDLASMFAEMEKGRGAAASMDPAVRELRDKALVPPAGSEGWELDAAMCPGTRGGLDYFGAQSGVAWVVSGEGASSISVVAARMARDEIVRALEAGANARKALAHANKVLFQRLPRGACARASLIEYGAEEAKLYQAGFGAPLWICRAGEVLELSAEGLALGLDDGPVFEKSLRSEKIDVTTGVRLVQSNDAGVRLQELLDLVRTHSPKHTAAFMNLVLGTLEGQGTDGLREDVLLLTCKRMG